MVLSIINLLDLVFADIHAVDAYFLFIIISCGLLALIYRLRSAKHNDCSHNLPKRYPHWEPIFGLDIIWRVLKAYTAHRVLAETTEVLSRVGPTFQYSHLGRHGVFTAEPDNVQAILSTKSTSFGLGSLRMRLFEPLLGRGIFNAEGDQWRRARGFLRPFISRVSKSEFAIFEKHTAKLLLVIESSGLCVDLQDLFSQATLDIATEVYFGKSTNLLGSDPDTNTAYAFIQASRYVQKAISGAERYEINDLATTMLFGNRKLSQALATIDTFIKDYMQSVVEGTNNAGEDLPTISSALFDKSCTFSEARDVFMNVLLGASNSQTSLMGSLWFVLARRPDVCARIRKEASDLCCSQPTLPQLQRMNYLQNVLKEVLRLYPPVPINYRTAMTDTMLPSGGGSDGSSAMFVPQGALVTYSVHALHRRRDIYGEDADDFNADRWESIRPNWAYIPFHGGPRTCPGQQFALLQASLMTIRMLMHFSAVVSNDDRPWTEFLGLNCFSRYGVKVKFRA